VTEFYEAPPLAIASVRRSHRVSVIWIVPLVAIAVAAWLAWNTLAKEGPRITITFLAGEGLQAGQSQLKYKDLTLGTVKSLALSADRGRVVVTVATTREAAPLLTNDAVFWVVKPRLFAGNLTGIYSGLVTAAGTFETTAGNSPTAPPAPGVNRNGDLDLGQFYYGAVQPSSAAAQVSVSKLDSW